jgi:hypothetical protein
MFGEANSTLSLFGETVSPALRMFQEMDASASIC